MIWFKKKKVIDLTNKKIGKPEVKTEGYHDLTSSTNPQTQSDEAASTLNFLANSSQSSPSTIPSELEIKDMARKLDDFEFKLDSLRRRVDSILDRLDVVEKKIERDLR